MNFDHDEIQNQLQDAIEENVSFGVPGCFYVFVPAEDESSSDKWLKSDPDNENSILGKGRSSAFEFKTFEHAKRGRDMVSIEHNRIAEIHSVCIEG